MTQKISNTGTYWNSMTAIISLTIMLYILGAMGMIAIYTDRFISTAKENIPFYIELEDHAKESEVFAFQQKLALAPSTKTQSVRYISKETALNKLDKEAILSKENMLSLGENILPNMIVFCINESNFCEYKKIVAEIEQKNFVSQVFFANSPAQKLSKKVYHLTIILIVLVIFFIFVSVTLIKNTLKLLLITHQENIHIMQMIGATFDFMAQPYLKQSINNGLISGLLAVLLLWISRYLIVYNLGISSANTLGLVLVLSLGILLISVLVSWGTTQYSTKKYLNKAANKWLV